MPFFFKTVSRTRVGSALDLCAGSTLGLPRAQRLHPHLPPASPPSLRAIAYIHLQHIGTDALGPVALIVLSHRCFTFSIEWRAGRPGAYTRY